MNEEDAQKIVKQEILNSNNTPLFTSGEVAAEKVVESPDGLIQKALDAAKALKLENDRREALIARDLLSGKSEAGYVVKEKTEEEKITEAANRLLKGSGFKI